MCMLWLGTLYYIRASICDPDDEVRVCACCGWEHYITSGPVFVIQMTRCVCVHVVAGNIILHQGQYL